MNSGNLIRTLFAYPLSPAKACLLAILLLLSAGGCNRNPKPVYKVGVSQPCSDEWRDKMNDEIRRELLFHDDIEVEFRAADNNSRRQIEDIRHFIDEGVDLIIVAPNEAPTVTPIIKEAYEKGIAIVTFDRNTYGDSYTSHFEPDNVEVGHQAGIYADQLFPGNVVALEIRGLENSTPAQQRHEGFKLAADSIPGFRLLSVDGDWNAPRAVVITDSMLKIHPEINVIYAHNDGMAIAASNAAKKAGRADIKIIGTDAAPSPGLKALRDRVIDASVTYPTEGGRVFRSAVDILHGKSVPKEDRLGNNSVVEPEHADFLLRQNDLLKDETDKVIQLKDANVRLSNSERMMAKYTYLLAAAAILLLLGIGILVFYLRQRKRYHDILTRKNDQLKEEQEKQKELYRQLEESGKSRMIFYTNVSHDLRTPLSLISGPIETIVTSPRLDREERGLMEIAKRNVSILKRLINQILDFRKMENDQLKPHLSETDFMKEALLWLESFRNYARERDINLIIDLQKPAKGNSAMTLAIDSEMMERVVFNLMSNAFRFTPPNGTITFKASFDSDELLFVVENTGAGIPKDELESIFKRFYQIDGYSSSGSGIGLALSKAMVELHGGSIKAYSEPGEPVRFEVRIPVSHIDGISPASPKGKEKPSLPDSKKELDYQLENRTANGFSIKPKMAESDILKTSSGATRRTGDKASSRPIALVAEDNADMRRLIKSYLSGDFDVIEAENGPGAVAMASKYRPDILVCDMVMPGYDGKEVCRLLKAEPSTCNIPILIMTACLAENQQLESYRSGADAYLEKPVEREMLVARCLNLIKSEKRKESHNQPSLPNDSSRVIKSGDSDRDPLALESDFYNQFIEIVTPMLSNPDLSSETIAAKIGLSSAQLGRRIKAITNYTPIEIVRKLRLQQAHTMLMSTELSISEIAFTAGFSSPAYLSKCFKDNYGVSPREFRARLSGSQSNTN